jgi:hypothetical protein
MAPVKVSVWVVEATNVPANGECITPTYTYESVKKGGKGKKKKGKRRSPKRGSSFLLLEGPSWRGRRRPTAAYSMKPQYAFSHQHHAPAFYLSRTR